MFHWGCRKETQFNYFLKKLSLHHVINQFKEKEKEKPKQCWQEAKPQTKFKFDLENLEDTERDLRNLCQDDGTKDIVFELLCQMWKEISDSHTQETQTLYDVKDEETQTDKVFQLFSLFSNLENENQEVFMESLGGLFNPEILKAAVATPNTSTVTLNKLLNVNKADFISECDPRLKAFFT